MDAMLDGGMNDELWAAQRQYLGSVGRGTLTWLMVAMGGADWNIAQPLIEPLGLPFIWGHSCFSWCFPTLPS